MTKRRLPGLVRRVAKPDHLTQASPKPDGLRRAPYNRVMSHAVQVRLLRPDEPTPQLESPNFVYANPRAGRLVEYRIEGLSGGHLLHLAVAGCVFGNLISVARARGIALNHALVAADGGFNEEGTRSTGITYRIEIEGDATLQELADLAAFVQQDSSVPEIVRHGAPVAATDAVLISSRGMLGPTS